MPVETRAMFRKRRAIEWIKADIRANFYKEKDIADKIFYELLSNAQLNW
jgi:hypothetical protein